MAATKRSFSILKKTWGEALSANFGIGFIVSMAMLLGIIPLILGAVAIASGLVPLGIAGIALGVVCLLAISLVSSALHTIIIGALYLYASEGTVPQPFDEEVFRHAFAHK